MSLSEHEAVDTILATLDKAEKGEAQAEQQTTPETASQEAEQTETVENEVEAVEQAEQPAIEPPPTWKAELKDDWKNLDRSWQEKLAQWETERNQGVNSKLNESAEAKKAAEAAIQATAQERQRYEQQLTTLIQQATALDPVLSHAAKMSQADWARLWQENPGQAGAFRQEVESRVATIQTWHQERQRLAYEQIRTIQAKAEAEIAERIPEWKDEAKRTALKTDIAKSLTTDYGFKPEELTMVLDPRHVQVALDAMRYRQMMAAQQTAQAKRAVATAPKVVKPGAAQDGPKGDSQRVKALKQRALRTGKEQDAINAVLAAIG